VKALWAAYMRTPASDSTADPLGSTPSQNSGAPKRPGMHHTLSKTMSMPSLRTPMPDNTPRAVRPDPMGEAKAHPSEASSVINPSGVGSDRDLQAYKDACLSREPLMLTLAPRPRSGMTTDGSRVTNKLERAAEGWSGKHLPRSGQNTSAPASPRVTSSPTTMSFPLGRPPNKRMPSQTLGPSYSKRAAFSPDDDLGRTSDTADEFGERRIAGKGHRYNFSLPTSRPITDSLQVAGDPVSAQH
jgi:hypothetical protein